MAPRFLALAFILLLECATAYCAENRLPGKDAYYFEDRPYSTAEQGCRAFFASPTMESYVYKRASIDSDGRVHCHYTEYDEEKEFIGYVERRDSSNASASTNESSRPTKNASEQFTADALKDLDQKSQQSFIGGYPTKYGEKGSTRPDSYVESLSLAVEVKNYDITKGTSALVSNVVTQAKKRQNELPAGSKQALVIDIRGQKVSDSVLNSMFEQINARSGNLFENRWWVLTD